MIIPVIPDQAAGNLAMALVTPSEDELNLRLQMEDELEQLEAAVKKVPLDADRAEAQIIFFDTSLVKLQNGTYGRIAKLTTQDHRNTAKQEYVGWKIRQLDSYDKSKLALRAAKEAVILDGNSTAEQRRINSLKSSLQGRIDQHAQQIRDRVTGLSADIDGYGASENLQRSLYINYVGQVDSIKQWIRPQLVSLHDKLIEVDVANYAAVNTALGLLLNELDPKVNDLLNALHSLKFETTVFNPAGTSTPNHSFTGDVSTASGSSRSRQSYDYGKDSLPKFEGDPIKYPKWKGEMKKSVLVGKEDEYALRLMSELSPEKDLDGQFDTQAEGWAHMDDLYANPILVAERIVNKFIAVKSLEGATVQAQLVFLSKMLRKLFLTLRVVKEESQLCENMPMINRAIKLMPNVYKEEFSDRIEEAETALGPDAKLTAPAKYKLFSAWLEKKEKKLTVYLNETLHKRPGRETTESDTPKETRREKQNRERQEKVLHFVEAQMAKSNEGGRGRKTPGATGSGARGSTRNGEVTIPSSQKAQLKEDWKKIKECPCCGKDDHAYEGKKGWFASDALSDCQKFTKDFSVDEKVEFVNKNKICWKCLSWRHQAKDCKKTEDKWYCRVKENGDLCKKPHSRYLHGSSVQIISHFLILHQSAAPTHSKFADRELNKRVLLPVMMIPINNTKAVTLFDGGATCCLVRNAFARDQGWKPYYTVQIVTLCGKKPEAMDICYYVFNLATDFGPRKILALGMDRLSEIPASQSIKFVYQLFPHLPKGSLERASGHLDLIIGQDHTDLQPGGDDFKDGLRVWTTRFGGRRVLTGSHPQIKFTNPGLTDDAKLWNNAQLRSPAICLNHVSTEARDTDHGGFLEAEMMGYSLPAMCNSCKKCPVCTMQTDGVSVKHHRELQLLRDSIKHDPVNKTVTCGYPVVDQEKYEKFVDNRKQAQTRFESTEKSLRARGLYDQYAEQVADYEKRGVWKRVTEAEIENWKSQGGKVHYCAHHGVEKPSSTSTQLRIVVDSALKNNWTGPRPREIYAKGPNFINDLFKVLLKWRSFKRRGAFDIKKAYHQLKTGIEEFFMRLVVWKDPVTGEWITFGHTVVGMGDVPASVLLELAKITAAEFGHDIDPMLAAQFIAMSYVDDGLIGGDDEDMARMRGKLVDTEDGSLRYEESTIVKMLDPIGCTPKIITTSGETDPRVLDMQGKVLGIQWNPTEDTLSYKLTINLTEKRGASRVGPDMSSEDLSGVRDRTWTRRTLLQAAQQNFDPLGMICCYTVRFKLILKEVVARGLTWDEALPDDLQQLVRDLVCEVLQLPELFFPAGIQPDHGIGRPELICYADGSTVAFGAVLYIRWRQEVPGAPYHTAIITAKSRVTPKSGMTPPRSELQGLVVAVRLATKVLDSMDVRPARVTIMTDSQCSVAACDQNASALQVFFRNRVLEIMNTMDSWGPVKRLDGKTELSQTDLDMLSEIEGDGGKKTFVDLIHHTPGLDNPADWPTRGQLEWSQMVRGQIWQDGYPYLQSPRSEWPMTRDGGFISKIPPEEKSKKFMEPSGDEINCVTLAHHLTVYHTQHRVAFLTKVSLIMEKKDSWTFARNTVARLLRIYRYRETPETRAELTKEDLVHAEWLAQLATMAELWKDLDKKNNLASLAIFVRHGVARSRGRLTEEQMMSTTGFDSLVVLPEKSRLAYLLTVEAHRDDHRATGIAQRVRRKGYWVIRGNHLAKRVSNNCLPCRKYKPATIEQKMADLPKVLMDVPIRPFSHVCLDYMGAITVKAMTNKRAEMKTFPLIFVCVNSGAVHVQLAADYSTQSFMLEFNHFMALRGPPSYVRCDMGSQLTAAVSKVEDGDMPRFKWKEIRLLCINYGTEFSQCYTQAQWRNGRAESAVRAFKRTLKHLHHGQKLNYAELSCLLTRAAAVINRRPIGARHHGGGEGEICVITPELLLQGGRLCKGPEHGEDLAEEFSTVSQHMVCMEQAFLNWWRMWFDQVWESLVPYKKWRTQHRNVQPGDIVLLQYVSKVAKPVYRYGRVLSVQPDRHGVVRSVTVGTRSRRGKEEKGEEYKPRKLDRQLVPVQRLVMLLPVEEQDKLPPASESLHICEEAFRVPAAGQELPATSPSPTHLSSSAPGPTEQSDTDQAEAESEPEPEAEAEAEAEQDADLTSARLINSIAVQHVAAQHPGDYFCWECEVREKTLYTHPERETFEDYSELAVTAKSLETPPTKFSIKSIY